VTGGDYVGKAKSVYIESTAGNVEIKAKGDVIIEGEHVKRINRASIWDSAPTRFTSSGLNVGFNGLLTSSSGLANFNNGIQISTNGAKGELFGISYAFGLYTTTQSIAHTGNAGYDVNMGGVLLYFKMLTGIA